MNKNKNTILLILAVCLGLFVVGEFAIDKIADRVIQKLQKDYSPSPYGPGINPDLLDSSKLNDK